MGVFKKKHKTWNWSFCSGSAVFFVFCKISSWMAMGISKNPWIWMDMTQMDVYVNISRRCVSSFGRTFWLWDCPLFFVVVNQIFQLLSIQKSRCQVLTICLFHVLECHARASLSEGKHSKHTNKYFWRLSSSPFNIHMDVSWSDIFIFQGIKPTNVMATLNLSILWTRCWTADVLHGWCEVELFGVKHARPLDCARC